MFSPHLFAHKYDIDDLLHALCGANSCWLETVNGTFTAEKPQHAPAGNLFEIQPLPATFLEELKTHTERTRLTEEEQQQLNELLAHTSVQQLPQYYSTQQTRLAGWLRERLKEAALEWLDAHNLIPPSMRHINRKAAPLAPGSKTVKISTPE